MPSPFVIPGVTLEEVLGAAKNTHGRRLYSLAATAAKDLADYVRDRRNDGDLEPVELAGAPAAAPPAAAGAPPPASGTVSRSTADLEALLTDRGRAALAALRVVAGEWRAPRDLAELLDVKVDLLTGALRDLRLAGLVEHNGKLRTAARVRVPAADASIVDDVREEAVSVPCPVPVGPDGEPDVAAARAELEDAIIDSREQAEAKVRAQDNGGYRGATITTPTHNVSPRVRRELEREQAEQRARAAGRRELPDGGTLAGRVEIALGHATAGVAGGATIPELASILNLTTGDELRDLVAVLEDLETNGDAQRRGHRQRGTNRHVVYAARSPSLA